MVGAVTIGTPLDERNVRREFDSILTAAKLPRIRIHDLRHTCASLLLVQGVHPRVVMELLGHSQSSLTFDTYSHVLPAFGARRGGRLENGFSGRGQNWGQELNMLDPIVRCPKKIW
jgi:integrase